MIATAADGIRVDGELVDGEAIVRGKDDPKPGEVVFSDTLRGFVIAQNTGGYALRVLDAKSEGIENFGGIDAFAYDPAWVITAEWSPNPEGTTMGFEHLKDDGRRPRRGDPRQHPVQPRRRRLRHRRVQVGTRAAAGVRRCDERRHAPTASGRFLYVAPNADGTITLDFNRAVIPPCAFSYAFNCPLPPKQNRFPFAVEAGEKNALAADGSLLHE